ncbi:HsdM family class I SAM-dependent methyltransferase [Pedobacter sp. AW31-3R]|uniref:HsdM family class I SAM-dependent methyltransferase n=1 Tax=Pedobacter sp. AW31-3R TaxID=3445781 RepID=UPI003FA0A62F
MHTNVYKALSPYIILGPHFVDSLIISSFLSFNSLTVVHNELLKNYRIPADENDERAEALDTFLKVIIKHTAAYTVEDLIELFEYVVSPTEKVVNGAVYTPAYIRDFIINSLLDQTQAPNDTCTLYDPACGCGGFLLTYSACIKILTGRSYRQIYSEQVYGIDIADYSLQRARLLLAIQALLAGEDENFAYNLLVANSLVFDPVATFAPIQANGGFDLVAGNPPYVASRNMDEDTLRQALTWPVSCSGHPDLYIPFFQIGINALNPAGRLGYITVNTFIKSINGRALRQYFEDEALNLTIINFGGEQVFTERNTYTCICIISRDEASIKYLRTNSMALNSLVKLPFKTFLYHDLNHQDGWNLVNSEELNVFIRNIEQTGIPFKAIYETKNGIATLMNDVYKFRPLHEDELYYYLPSPDQEFRVERILCRDIVNANKVKVVEDITRLNEKIIFPYRPAQGRLEIIPEDEMLANFPEAYRYLLSKKAALATRDRGKRIYEEWYAFGRRQSMDILAYKLFFPHICERPTFVICDQLDLLFYNGIAVISNDRRELELLKRILESELFYNYIKSTTKDYSSGYISMSRNYLKNFGIPQLTTEQQERLLTTDLPDNLINSLYEV